MLNGAKRIRGGRGLGDALYVRPIVDYYVAQGERLVVLTDYYEVFTGAKAEVAKFERIRTDIVAHYVNRKAIEGTTQWQDVCAEARVPIDLPLRINWKVRNHTFISGLKAQAAGRHIVLVHGGRMPMNRTDGFGLELLPSVSAFDAVLHELRDCFLVQIGKATQLYKLRCEVDLNGGTTVSDLLDLGSVCDAVVAQCSFAIPLAEAFDKPLLAIWGGRATSSPTLFVRQTTPTKVLSSARDRFVIDSWSQQVIREEARAFRDFR